MADGTAESKAAARAAVEVTRGTGSVLHVVCCSWSGIAMPHPRPYAPEKAAALAERRERDGLALLEEAAAWISGEGAGVAGSHYREGEPRREIIRLAGELGVGLIVVGRREMGAAGRAFHAVFPQLWSLADKIYHRAPCPVMVVRQQHGQAASPVSG